MARHYRNPLPAVDVIIERPGGVVLIKRSREPYGWALPGGFVEEGETVEEAAVREASEETSLALELIEQFAVYSDPKRDPRGHTVSIVFIARAEGALKASDDAAEAGIFPVSRLPSPLCFDHPRILDDFRSYRETGQKPRLIGRRRQA
jgi:8-oxo-dGTP diphosphatase